MKAAAILTEDNFRRFLATNEVASSSCWKLFSYHNKLFLSFALKLRLSWDSTSSQVSNFDSAVFKMYNGAQIRITKVGFELSTRVSIRRVVCNIKGKSAF